MSACIELVEMLSKAISMLNPVSITFRQAQCDKPDNLLKFFRCQPELVEGDLVSEPGFDNISTSSMWQTWQSFESEISNCPTTRNWQFL